MKFNQINRIFEYKDNNRTLEELVLRLLHKEIEEIVPSKVIITEGWVLSANIIKTANVNGE